MEDQHRPPRPLGRNQATAFNQLGHLGPVTDPKRIAGGFAIQPGAKTAEPVRAGHEIERAVELGHIVEKNMQIQGAWPRHPILGVMRGKIIALPNPKALFLPSFKTCLVEKLRNPEIYLNTWQFYWRCLHCHPLRYQH